MLRYQGQGRSMLINDTCILLTLHRLPKLTDSMLARLLAVAVNPKSVFQLSSEVMFELEVPLEVQKALSRLASTGYTAQQKLIEKDWELIQRDNIQLISIASPVYPELLKQINDPPPLLYARGNTTLLNQPQLAMVGSRRTSNQGLENAFRFARELAKNGFTITSGLALGIDAQCHSGALSADGDTIGVLGTGIDRIYPARNREIFERVIEKGLLISEFHFGTEPRPYCFPRRNRIISGMSLGVLVVEAAKQSGSLITARMALEQNREVLAIPSSIHNLGGKGCNSLIRQGAKLVETTADVFEELKGWLPTPIAGPKQEEEFLLNDNISDNISDKEKQLLDYMGYDPAPIDLLLWRSGWSTAELLSMLTALEIKGKIENQSGSYLRKSSI